MSERRTKSWDRHNGAIQSRNIQTTQDVIYKHFSFQFWFIFQFSFGCFHAVHIFTGTVGLDTLVYKEAWIRCLSSFDQMSVQFWCPTYNPCRSNTQFSVVEMTGPGVPGFPCSCPFYLLFSLLQCWFFLYAVQSSSSSFLWICLLLLGFGLQMSREIEVVGIGWQCT